MRVEFERREKLESMVKQAFPEEEITILTKALAEVYKDDPTWRIGIHVNKEQRTCRVVIRPTKQLMTDEKIDFTGVFQEGIEVAKNILCNPPRKEYFQGTILLTCKGAKFYEGDSLKGWH